VHPLSETEKTKLQGLNSELWEVTEGLKISGDKNLVKTGVK
jgi:hypothetical protein